MGKTLNNSQSLLLLLGQVLNSLEKQRCDTSLGFWIHPANTTVKAALSEKDADCRPFPVNNLGKHPMLPPFPPLQIILDASKVPKMHKQFFIDTILLLPEGSHKCLSE